MKKTKLTLKICLILMVIFIICLTIFKLNYKPMQNNSLHTINDVGEVVYYDHKIDYKEVYKDNIIYEIVIEIPYSIVDENSVLQGRLLIGNDRKLYITNDIIQTSYLVLDKEIKTLYNPLPVSEVCSFYVLTSEGEVYHIGLSNTYIDDSTLSVKKHEFSSAVTNFTTLSIHSFIGDVTNNIVVLCEDGNMYDIYTSILYSDDVFKVKDQYIIYGDGHVTNFSSNILVDANNNEYQIKNVVGANDRIQELNNSPNIVLITTDDRLIYLINHDKVYEHYKKVKAVFPQDDIINIVFEDDETLKFSGYYNQEFYPILYKKDGNSDVET